MAGEPSRDGRTFFARRILAFSPDLRRRRFHVPLRKCDFYDDRALCRDMRRELVLCVDPAALHTLWDRTWNQWKHLLGTKIEVGTFVQSGKYRKRREKWDLVTWETALPSRLEVKLPPDFHLQVEATENYLSPFQASIRGLWIRSDCAWNIGRSSEQSCSECVRSCEVPGDFGFPQISWRLVLDPFFSPALTPGAPRILSRRELHLRGRESSGRRNRSTGPRDLCVRKRRSMDSFLALYTKITKDNIRRNRDDAAEQLGFLGRVIHGTNPRAWLKEVRQRVGEGIDFAAAVTE